MKWNSAFVSVKGLLPCLKNHVYTPVPERAQQSKHLKYFKCNLHPAAGLTHYLSLFLDFNHGLFQRHESFASSHTLYFQPSCCHLLHGSSCHRRRECAQGWPHYCVRYVSARFLKVICLHPIPVLLLTTTWCWTLPFFVRDRPFHTAEILKRLNLAAGFPYQRMLNYWSKGVSSPAKKNVIHLDFVSEPFRTPYNALDSIFFWQHPSRPEI